MSEPKFEFLIDDEHPEYTLEARAEKADADRIFFGDVLPRLDRKAILYKPKQKNHNKKPINQLYNKLYEDAQKRRIRVDDLFLDIELKRKALENIMGYRYLKGAGEIENATPQTVSNVYRKAYYSSEQAKEKTS